MGLPTSADFERGTRTFRPEGLLGAAASSTWIFGPFSMSSHELFRTVVALTVGFSRCNSGY
eukprot:5902340-Alexandrium_andersonii.AAC.1